MGRRTILAIAGSDSSGGLEADQKVIAAHGCYAMTATTALTAQNTTGVFAIHQTPPEFVRKQIDACIEDVGVDAVKTGMLASAETIRVVADAFRRHQVKISVVDPVMISTSGHQLLPEAAVETLIAELLPLTTILTPNLSEAKLILSTAGVSFSEPGSQEDLVTIAKLVKGLGPRYVLLKGGHIPFTKDGLVATTDSERKVVVNVLYGGYEDERLTVVRSDYLTSRNTHGTGCSLASAIASNLAQGMSMSAAVQAANLYVEAGIRTSTDMGRGSGPINHFHSTYTLPFAPEHFIDWLLERFDVRGAWRSYTHHAFVQQLADGTLPLSNFQTYLIQDYLFLIQFTRAHAHAATKAREPEAMQRSLELARHITAETQHHLTLCAAHGLSRAAVLAAGEKPACTAYTRYVLDVGHAEDWFALHVALLPCTLGYAAIVRRLQQHDDDDYARQAANNNPYWDWVRTYTSDEYQLGVKLACDLVETHAVKQSPSRIEELVAIFVRATELEIGFWDMALRGN